MRLYYLSPFPYLVALTAAASETSGVQTTYHRRAAGDTHVARLRISSEVALALVVAVALLDCLPFTAASAAFLCADGHGLASLPPGLMVSGAVAVTSNLGLLLSIVEESSHKTLYSVLRHDDEVGPMVMVFVAVVALATVAPLLYGLL